MEVNEITYSAAVSELENILRKMQSNEIDIDELAKYTARSLELLKVCRAKLHNTDEEIKRCLEELS